VTFLTSSAEEVNSGETL